MEIHEKYDLENTQLRERCTTNMQQCMKLETDVHIMRLEKHSGEGCTKNTKLCADTELDVHKIRL